jgi:hypothetical protein
MIAKAQVVEIPSSSVEGARDRLRRVPQMCKERGRDVGARRTEGLMVSELAEPDDADEDDF